MQATLTQYTTPFSPFSMSMDAVALAKEILQAVNDVASAFGPLKSLTSVALTLASTIQVRV